MGLIPLRIPWLSKRKRKVPVHVSSLVSLREEIDRLFDTFLRDPFAVMESAWEPLTRLNLPVDIAENDQELVVRAEVPGVDPEDLDVTISGNILTISGQKREFAEQRDKDFYQSECSYGEFRRTITLPMTVDPGQVEANYNNGVLVVKIKKRPEAQGKRIQVRST